MSGMPNCEEVALRRAPQREWLAALIPVFWVDHGEPMGVLQSFKARNLRWAFGDLPEGHEFLALLDISVTPCTMRLEPSDMDDVVGKPGVSS